MYTDLGFGSPADTALPTPDFNTDHMPLVPWTTGALAAVFSRPSTTPTTKAEENMIKYLVCVSYNGGSGPSSLIFPLSARDPADAAKKTRRMLEHEQWLSDHGVGPDHELRYCQRGISVTPMTDLVIESENTHRRQMLSERM
jgi:hypothetical protein